MVIAAILNLGQGFGLRGFRVPHEARDSKDVNLSTLDLSRVSIFQLFQLGCTK